MRFGHKISVFGLAGSLALRIFVATIYAGQDGHRVKRPPILGVGGIGLRTNDMNAARNFYGHVLGYREYSLDHAAGGGRWTYFKVNGHQYVEIFPDLKSETQDRLRYVAFETSDVRQLREYLASRNVQVPETVEPGLDGNLRFSITDPQGHEIQFVQYTPEAFSMPGKNGNKVDERISRRMIHCGFTVRDRAAED